MEFLQNLIDRESFPSSTGRDKETKIRFNPPVYEQRYHRVADILSNERIQSEIKNIAEFGVAEMKSFVILKNSLTNIEKMDLIDIDGDLLEEYKGRVDPLIAEYLSKREKKLTVNVWQGSISTPNPNLSEVDAVIAIELIEHVFPDVFEEIPYNIFNEIKPKIALFTTPNSDFNELFEMEPGKFRHYDHKFEWTRDEFKDWAENICARFPNYSVLLTGIGKGPENSAHLGCCSQMAVFIRKDLIEHIENFDENQVKIDDNDDETEESKLPIIESEDYKLIHSVAYPFFKDRRTLEEKLECEIDYSINSLRYYEDDYYNYEENQIQIPIQCIYNSCSNVSEDCDAIKKLLEKKYVIRDDHVILPSNDQSESDCDN